MHNGAADYIIAVESKALLCQSIIMLQVLSAESAITLSSLCDLDKISTYQR